MSNEHSAVEERALRRVLVTGATGLLGGNVVRELIADGVEVLALVRDADRARRLLPEDPRVKTVVGDVTDIAGFRDRLPGLDAVIHTAAYFREYYEPGHDLDRLRRTNVDAVRDLLGAADAAGVPVVVHTSSSGAVGPPPEGQLADEDAAPGEETARNAYFASKVAADGVVAEFVAGHRTRVSVVLPGWMWGPGDAAPTSAGRLFLAIARGELGAIPRTAMHVVDARDVAVACVQAARTGVSGRRYLVAGRRQDMATVVGEVARAAGVAAPREVPAVAALMVATLLEAAARLRRRPAIANREGVRVLMEGTRRRMSSARAEDELGVRFRPLAETMADEAAWYLEQGTLARAGGVGAPVAST